MVFIGGCFVGCTGLMADDDAAELLLCTHAFP